MKIFLRGLLIGTLFIVYPGCDNEFNPIASFQPKMVIYSVLSTESDTQYVRVYTSFDSNTNSSSSSISDATLQMSTGSTVYTFRDTTLQGTDSTAAPIRLFYNPSMRPQRDKLYSLAITSPSYGSATATTMIPGAGSVFIIYDGVLRDPQAEGPFYNVDVTIYLSQSAKGFLARLFVYFLTQTRTVPSHDEEIRVEVPERIREISIVRGEYEYFYPKPRRRVNQNSIFRPEGFGWDSRAYLKTVRDIQYNYLNVRFTRAVIRVVQFDEAFYKYYAVANLYHDLSSVKLDEPDFTNIVGGVGVFGSLAVDSVFTTLPQRIPVQF